MNIIKLFNKSEVENKQKNLLVENKINSEWDEVFQAWTSNNLEKMLKVADVKTTLNNRHFLLQAIVSETFKLRNEVEYQKLCIKFSEIHLAEFKEISHALKSKTDESLPRILTFQNYATLLTEIGEYEKAISVCELAISYNLSDGTKSHYHGRIERIRKKASK